MNSFKKVMKTSPHIVLNCPACGRQYDPGGGLLGCPHRRTDQEHTLTKQTTFDASAAVIADTVRRSWRDGPKDPYRLFSTFFSSRAILGRQDYRRILDTLNSRMAAAEGRSFQVTPLVDARHLAAALDWQGRLFIKNETGNISGSHKSRHLMGSLLYLEALRRRQRKCHRHVLAVYSCGNAALGAAAVARAGRYELHAFVPDDVDPVVEQLLAERGARVRKIKRDDTGIGDPCYLAFQQALQEKGWLPFSCSGNDNWSNIEGGETLGWETLMQTAKSGSTISCMVIQAGGGALGRAIAQAWQQAVKVGLARNLPRIYVCQPEGGFPFVRAYLLLLARIAAQNGLDFDLANDHRGDPRQQLADMKRFSRSRSPQIRRAANFARRHFDAPTVQTVLKKAVLQRGNFMWPWDGKAPHSLAHGILDDETYDWYDLAVAVLKSGGRAEIIDEQQIARANAMARQHTDMTPCATGTAGLAGLLQLTAAGDIGQDENVALYFTGLDRSATKTAGRDNP